ncbi:hypothetical protein KL924_005320, partial [Ogataea haglerorum]
FLVVSVPPDAVIEPIPFLASQVDAPQSSIHVKAQQTPDCYPPILQNPVNQRNGPKVYL